MSNSSVEISRSPENDVGKVDILGVHVSATNPEAAWQRVNRWVAEGERQYVIVSDVHSILEAKDDPALLKLYNDAGMVLPDGVPLVWSGRAAGFTEMKRVCGPDFMPLVLERSVSLGWRHFFVGGAEGVGLRLRDVMVARYPGLQVVGVECPPFRPATQDEMRQLADRINEAAPDVVWVGLGVPKQERWIAAFRPMLDASVLFGVGAAFNFHTGTVQRAPAWMQQSGLEWLFRLSQEPRRLWRRYLLGIPRFAGGITRERPHRVKQ